MSSATLKASDQAASRLKALQGEMKRLNIHGFIQKIGDEYQSEYVPDYARRLEWLTGFDGSAGWVAVTLDKAALLVDGRYTIQAKQEVDATLFEHHNVTDIPPEQWIATNLKEKEILGFDPWLFTLAELRKWDKALRARGIGIKPLSSNPIDAIWADRPAPPSSPAIIHPDKFAGQTSADKRAALAKKLQELGVDAAVITATDSINWLLNIRGSDIPHNPVALCFALLFADGTLSLYIDPAKITAEVEAHLGKDISVYPQSELEAGLKALAKKKVLYDPRSSSLWFHETLKSAGAVIGEGADPCQHPKACKNEVEINGTRSAHLRDGAAIAKLLHWVDHTKKASELDVVAKALEYRRQNNLFVEPSFATISGSGPNGAIVHYRVNDATNRALDHDTFLLIDSGGQYHDGTTDITRTVAMGTVNAEMKDRFTRVLKGHIALSTAIFPKGTTGGQLDALARLPLWEAGLDFDHGTGHGVGSFLNVHEGPQRIGRRGADAALEVGMILSNEPGYYKTDAYGIRIENLLVVQPADKPGFLTFETLTLAPIDTRAVLPELLTAAERQWLNAYHARVEAALSPQLDQAQQSWLSERCRPV